MLNSLHQLSGGDPLSGGIALSVFVIGAAVAVLVALGALAFRHSGQSGVSSALWGSALVLVGVLVASVLLDRPATDESAAERRAIESREAELTVRAIAPGSALACIDTVANVEVQTACEKALFASPEAVAAAVAYVDARISLLAASSALAERDARYRPPIERMRRALEADRFGLVGHVLSTRGCDSSACPEFKLLRNTATVIVNMQARTFDGRVSEHAAAWHANSAAMAATAPPLAVAAPALPQPATTGLAHGGPLPGNFYPSAASIPAVSIMNAEPSSAPSAAAQAEARQEPQATPIPPKRSQSKPPRRQSARETASQRPSAPLSVVPQTTPPPPTTPTTPQPQTSGTR